MGYDVSLYKIPKELKDQRINDNILFDIAYGEAGKDHLLIYTNFSMDNSQSVDFGIVFDILLTNNDFFKIYKMSDYIETKKRLQTMNLDEALLERINKFLTIIENELNKGEIIFFCCD
jgi:hypothetical protein